MFSCYNNKTVDIDGVSCNSGGEYWRFENRYGKIVPVLVQRFGIDYDDETPFAGYSQVFPDEEPEWIEETGSQAPVVDGRMSAELTGLCLRGIRPIRRSIPRPRNANSM